MSKRNHIVERASDVNGGQYIQTNPSYNSGYEDGKKAGKEYCAAELAALREQVEKLTAERDTLTKTLEFTEHTRDVELIRHRNMSTAKRERLAALAEQNVKLRETLIAISIAWSSNEIYSQHFFNEALSLPDLATPALNWIKAEAYLEAADYLQPLATHYAE